jgi:hypothetical protein
MEQQGLLIRTWGGAVATGGVNADPPLFLRSKSNLPKKNIIADSATALIRDGMTLFLASGTTVERLAHNLLKFQNLTVITNGLDIAAAYGTPIYAADAGTVIFADWDKYLGWCVKIDHGNGIISIYGHASSLAKTVYAGKKVYQGEVVSYVGSTGNSTGNHLHFALYQKSTGKHLDPQKYL